MKKKGAKQESYGSNAGVILRKNDSKVLTTGSERNEVTYKFLLCEGQTVVFTTCVLCRC